MGQIRFTLKGVTPLLMHNPNSMARPKASIGRKEIPSPEEEAEAGAYRLPSGDLCVPAVAVRNSMLRACSGYRHGKKALRPYVAGSLLPADMMFPLVTAEGEPMQDYEVDVQRAVIQRQGIMRARPRIDPPWYVVCLFNYNEGLMSWEALENSLKTVIADAGKIVGILDYRVEKAGWYGTYELVSLELLK